MGSNFAECHPVGFRWVLKARERGAQVIHIDPRFTRTSAMSNQHVAIRSGSDIAFLGGLVNYIIENNRWFREYVLPYTNASTIVGTDFRDTEDLDGLFSGFDAAQRRYETRSWAYDGTMAAQGDLPRATDRPQPLEGQPPVDYRRRPPQHRSHTPAPALRLPDPEAALRTVHSGDGRRSLRMHGGAIPSRGADVV